VGSISLTCPPTRRNVAGAPF